MSGKTFSEIAVSVYRSELWLICDKNITQKLKSQYLTKTWQNKSPEYLLEKSTFINVLLFWQEVNNFMFITISASNQMFIIMIRF